MTSLLLTEKEPARRGFLRSLIMAPAAALATHKLILPGETTPEERARRAWADFCAAMREISADADGWKIIAAGEFRASEHMPASAKPWLDLRTVHFENAKDPRCPELIVERHREIIL